MLLIDLSRTICDTMPVYPGTAPPRITRQYTVEKDGFAEAEVTLLTHTGTHIDAPAHLLADGRTLDRMPIDRFAGKGYVIPVRGQADNEIAADDLKPFEEMIEQCDFVLMDTGWSRLWGQNAYFTGYPALSADAARWLLQFDLKGFGGDVISVDKADAAEFTVHKILLGNNLMIIENLVNLDRLAGRLFDFFCMPLKFDQADGSPVRAFAVDRP